jgi:BirA family biotin operon repressor/biotin-[acetyl-CoA-carboxylase] ligase
MTFPDYFFAIHLDRCRSTSEYIRTNLPRLAADLPLVVNADGQEAGRGREGRSWHSPPGLGIYSTFAFRLSDHRRLPFLSLAAGIAVADALAGWTGAEFSLKWPNDVLAAGRKIAGILCENMVFAERVTCLVGIGINLNQRPEDFPPELRKRALSLRLLTGREWPVAEGRERLAAGMAAWLRRLEADSPETVLSRARHLSRPFLGREIRFHHQGRILGGIFCGLAADGGLLLKMKGGEERVFHDGEISI